MDKIKVLSILDETISRSSADQTEIIAAERKLALTRFANSTINQNLFEKNVYLSARVIVDKKIGHASTNSLDKDALKKTVEKAIVIAKNSASDPNFKSLPKKESLAEKRSFSEASASFSPYQRAQVISLICDKASSSNLLAAGSFSNTEESVAIANSLGVRTAETLTEAALSVIISNGKASGYASATSYKASDIKPEKLADIAIEKALAGKNPKSITPGAYPVILEEEAVAEMISWLALYGLGALSYQEGRSFLVGKLGKKILGENLTLIDDALDPRMPGFPFDFEGMPKRKTVLIEEGVAKNLAYDSYTAAKEGKKSTGHALPSPNIYGPLPTNLILENGKSSTHEMITSMERGILVTRFHYTNIEDPIKMILTGTTRDGTFLIEDGKIKKGIKSLRFTQNILEALNNVEAISSKIKLTKMFGAGYSLVPSLKISKFNFTGISGSKL